MFSFNSHFVFFLIVFLALNACTSEPETSPPSHTPSTLPRVVITSDISPASGDPDDKQSMAHLLMYANEVDIVSIIPDRWERDGVAITYKCIETYRKDFNNPDYNFSSQGYPHPDSIKAVVQQHAEAAENHLISLAKNEDPRPLHVLIWGNMHTVKNALQKAPEIAPKLRLYTIGTHLMAQNPDAAEHSKGTEPYGKRINWNGPGRNDIFNDPRFTNTWWVENDWAYNGMFVGEEPGKLLLEIKNYGELGYFIWEEVQAKEWAHYFRAGDTPTVLYFLEPGADIDDPTTHTWAGTFVRPFPETRPNYWIDDAGNSDWNYADPSQSWELFQEVYDHRVNTFVSHRAEMHEAFREKMRNVYNQP